MITALEAIDQTTASLRSLGIKSGTRVALHSHYNTKAIILTIACWKLGAVIVPLSTNYTREMATSAVDSLGCRFLFSASKLAEAVNFAEPVFSGIIFEHLDLNLNREGSIILTSGSSASPKGILHTIGNHYYSALGSDQNIPFNEKHTWLASLPIYHISGLSLVSRALLHGGAISCPSPEESLTDAVKSHSFTHLSLVPMQLKVLLDDRRCLNRLKQVQAILVGGDVCPAKLVDLCAEQGLPLFLSYGSSEMASQITTTRPDKAVLNSPSSGQLLHYRELKVSDNGEILVKGLTCFKSYIVKEKEEKPFDQEGWFQSGDLGHLDQEGNLYLHGRLDNMFISGGENIYPELIEQAILSLSGIERCVVVPVDDQTYGKRPLAFIQTDGRPLMEREFFLTQLALLEDFRIPDHFYKWPKEMDTELKVDRRKATKIARLLLKKQLVTTS